MSTNIKKRPPEQRNTLLEHMGMSLVSSQLQILIASNRDDRLAISLDLKTLTPHPYLGLRNKVPDELM